MGRFVLIYERGHTPFYVDLLFLHSSPCWFRAMLSVEAHLGLLQPSLPSVPEYLVAAVDEVVGNGNQKGDQGGREIGDHLIAKKGPGG